MAAVLSLNGKPQATLRVQGQQQLSGDAAVAVGAATQQLMQVLGALTRIKISDGRVVVGRLHCFDKHQNVILTDAREFPPLSTATNDSTDKLKQQQPTSRDDDDTAFEKHRSEVTSRSLGMTLVPGKHIVYIKVMRVV